MTHHPAQLCRSLVLNNSLRNKQVVIFVWIFDVKRNTPWIHDDSPSFLGVESSVDIHGTSKKGEKAILWQAVRSSCDLRLISFNYIIAFCFFFFNNVIYQHNLYSIYQHNLLMIYQIMLLYYADTNWSMILVQHIYIYITYNYVDITIYWYVILLYQLI